MPKIGDKDVQIDVEHLAQQIASGLNAKIQSWRDAVQGADTTVMKKRTFGATGIQAPLVKVGVDFADSIFNSVQATISVGKTALEVAGPLALASGISALAVNALASQGQAFPIHITDPGVLVRYMTASIPAFAAGMAAGRLSGGIVVSALQPNAVVKDWQVFSGDDAEEKNARATTGVGLGAPLALAVLPPAIAEVLQAVTNGQVGAQANAAWTMVGSQIFEAFNQSGIQAQMANYGDVDLLTGFAVGYLIGAIGQGIKTSKTVSPARG